MATEYTNNQFSLSYDDGIENSYWNIARKKLILKYIKRFKVNNLLDVGCGRGIVTSYLYHAGLSITGVELGSTTNINKSDLKIYYNTDALNLPEEFRKTVNAIALFDVIEHIEDPIHFIKNIASKYPNASTLFIAVPARKELWCNFDEYYGHFRRYNLDSLQQEIEEMGFEVVLNRYFFHTLYIAILLNNLLFKRREVRFNAPKSSLALILHKLFGNLFYFEAIVLPSIFWGSSIISVCKRK